MSRPDKNLESYANQTGVRVIGPRVIDGRGYDDALKFSNCSSVFAKDLTILGGREDCIDINRGEVVTIGRCDLRPDGRYAMTIKGGAQVVAVLDTIIAPGATSTDIEIGNWSDQSQAMTTVVALSDVTKSDGSPVRVRVWRGERPSVIGDGKVEIAMVPRPIVALFFGYKRARRWLIAKLPAAARILPVLVATALLGACSAQPKPQSGGGNTTTLGGATAPTTATLAAPQNPQSPTRQTLERTITRDYAPPTLQQDRSVVDHRTHNPEAVGSIPTPASIFPGSPFRETVTERAVTELGTAQKDTARELGARLANMRGVMWVGIALMVGGPLLGWQLGWIVNGMIAGAVGLGLVILAQVVPGNEAWFGLFGLLLLPVVAYAYYKSQADARGEPAPVVPAPTATPTPSA